MTIEENSIFGIFQGKKYSLRWGLNLYKQKLFKQHLSKIPLGLESRLKTKVKLLSGGQRQVLTLVMAINEKTAVATFRRAHRSS